MERKPLLMLQYPLLLLLRKAAGDPGDMGDTNWKSFRLPDQAEEAYGKHSLERLYEGPPPTAAPNPSFRPNHGHPNLLVYELGREDTYR